MSKPKKADVEKLARELYDVGGVGYAKSRREKAGYIWSEASTHQRAGLRAVAKYVLANFKRKDV